LILKCILLILLVTIYFILLDELIISNTQRRKGPFNLGSYGILSSIINGLNLIISQFLIPKLFIHYWFQAFPILFLLFSLAIYNVIFPFLFIDLYLSFIILLLLSGLSIILLFLLSYTGLSKYSMLGCIRLISQLVAYELILTTLLLLLIWNYNELNITNYYLFLYIFNILCFMNIWTRKLFCLVLISLILLFYNYVFLIIGLICILAELNRVPFDLPESESELVAGFITEYSSIYFSLILLTEYSNIIALILFYIILFSIIFSLSILLLLLICLIRSTLNRLKFDELMTNCWIVTLPIIFVFLLLAIS